MAQLQDLGWVLEFLRGHALAYMGHPADALVEEEPRLTMFRAAICIGQAGFLYK
jgi:hypothetical protein